MTDRVQESDAQPVALRSRLLDREGFSHAFFTRQGGASTGPYRSLSFSLAAGDAPDAVAENVARAGRSLGVDPRHLYWASQVHGATVREVCGDVSRQDVLAWEADALWSALPGVACGVRHADCVPVLLADRRTGRVAAVHAGWRGVVAGVVPGSVRSLTPSPEGIVAAVGPHISAEAFEVSDDVAALLAAASDARAVVRRGPGKPHVDLFRIVEAQLVASGVTADRIERVGGCTVREPEHYFSFRRDGARSGRHLSAIVPRSPG